jgi:hypothetical protein
VGDWGRPYAGASRIRRMIRMRTGPVFPQGVPPTWRQVSGTPGPIPSGPGVLCVRAGFVGIVRAMRYLLRLLLAVVVALSLVTLNPGVANADGGGDKSTVISEYLGMWCIATEGLLEEWRIVSSVPGLHTVREGKQAAKEMAERLKSEGRYYVFLSSPLYEQGPWSKLLNDYGQSLKSLSDVYRNLAKSRSELAFVRGVERLRSRPQSPYNAAIRKALGIPYNYCPSRS